MDETLLHVIGNLELKQLEGDAVSLLTLTHDLLGGMLDVGSDTTLQKLRHQPDDVGKIAEMMKTVMAVAATVLERQYKSTSTSTSPRNWQRKRDLPGPGGNHGHVFRSEDEVTECEHMLHVIQDQVDQERYGGLPG